MIGIHVLHQAGFLRRRDTPPDLFGLFGDLLGRLDGQRGRAAPAVDLPIMLARRVRIVDLARSVLLKASMEPRGPTLVRVTVADEGPISMP